MILSSNILHRFKWYRIFCKREFLGRICLSNCSMFFLQVCTGLKIFIEDLREYMKNTNIYLSRKSCVNQLSYFNKNALKCSPKIWTWQQHFLNKITALPGFKPELKHLGIWRLILFNNHFKLRTKLYFP